MNYSFMNKNIELNFLKVPMILGTFSYLNLGDDNIKFLTKHSIQDINNMTEEEISLRKLKQIRQESKKIKDKIDDTE